MCAHNEISWGRDPVQTKAFMLHAYLLPKTWRLFYTILPMCLYSDCDFSDMKISILGVILVPTTFQILEHFRFQRFGLAIFQTTKSGVLFVMWKVLGFRGEESLKTAFLHYEGVSHENIQSTCGFVTDRNLSCFHLTALMRKHKNHCSTNLS